MLDPREAFTAGVNLPVRVTAVRIPCVDRGLPGPRLAVIAPLLAPGLAQPPHTVRQILGQESIPVKRNVSIMLINILDRRTDVR